MSTGLALSCSAILLLVWWPLGPPGLLLSAVSVAVVWLLWLSSRPRSTSLATAPPDARSNGAEPDAPTAPQGNRAPALVFSLAAAKAPAQPARSSPPRAAATRSNAHFTRHAKTPGWLYAMRNDCHAEDLYKVGYTTRTPEDRARDLNRGARRITQVIGWWTVVHKARVPRSYEAEQHVFALLAQYRKSDGKEFVCAPLSVVADAIDATASAMAANAAAPMTVHVTCPGCSRVQSLQASPFDTSIDCYCPACGDAWTARPQGQEA